MKHLDFIFIASLLIGMVLATGYTFKTIPSHSEIHRIIVSR